jgi:hypothetical protein
MKDETGRTSLFFIRHPSSFGLPLTLTLSPGYRGEGTEGADLGIVEQAARWEAHPQLVDLTREALAQVSASRGVDFATALLYDRIRRDARHGAFIARVESIPAPLPAPDATLVIVPGALYRSNPHTEADGRRLTAAARAAGFRTDLVPLLDFGPVDANARVLLDWLAARARDDGRPLILASLSKGSMEVKRALAERGAADAFRHVTAWINFSGVPDGSLLADWMLGGPLRRVVTRLACRWVGADYRVMHQLTAGAGAAGAWPALPRGMRVVHVVGFPLRSHLTIRLARKNHRRLAPFGPNDGGGVLLADACRWPGRLYPVWGADHFMRPPGGIEQMVRGLLAAVCGRRGD